MLNQASFSFDLSVADLYYSLYGGHTLVGLSRKTQDNPTGLFNAIMENNITVTVTTPTFMKMCLLNDEFDALHCPSLRCMYFCGEVLDVDAFTGGFNLQIAFSTGFAAGNSIKEE